jgi:hypothetical protein
MSHLPHGGSGATASTFNFWIRGLEELEAGAAFELIGGIGHEKSLVQERKSRLLEAAVS